MIVVVWWFGWLGAAHLDSWEVGAETVNSEWKCLSENLGGRSVVLFSSWVSSSWVLLCSDP